MLLDFTLSSPHFPWLNCPANYRAPPICYSAITLVNLLIRPCIQKSPKLLNAHHANCITLVRLKRFSNILAPHVQRLQSPATGKAARAAEVPMIARNSA